MQECIFLKTKAYIMGSYVESPCWDDLGAYLKHSFHGVGITKTRLFKYTENFTTKNENFQKKNSDIFHILCSKHRLWVLIRTASARQF